MYLIAVLLLGAGPVAPAYAPQAEPFTGQVTFHSGRPTILPKLLSHTYRTWGQCGCLMCLGQHMRNMHGEKNAALDKLGWRNWRAHHDKLHSTGVAPKVKPSGCPGGVCPAPAPQGVRGVLRRFWR